MNPKLFRALVALSALITALLGAVSYVELLPASYAGVAGTITAALLGLKEIIVIVGDIADDGVRNNSFKPEGQQRSEVRSQRSEVRGQSLVIIAFMLSLLMPSCVNLTKDEAQAAAKEIAVEIGFGAGGVAIDVARARLLRAELELQEALITPGVGVKNLIAKQVAVEVAKRGLDAAEKELAKARAKHAASAKQPVNVQPQAARKAKSEGQRAESPGLLTNVRNNSAKAEGLDRDTGGAVRRFAIRQDSDRVKPPVRTPIFSAGNSGRGRFPLMTSTDLSSGFNPRRAVAIPILAPQVVASLKRSTAEIGAAQSL